MQFEIRIGVAAEEETVFDTTAMARVVGCLADLHPFLLNRGGDEVNGGQAEAEA